MDSVVIITMIDMLVMVIKYRDMKDLMKQETFLIQKISDLRETFQKVHRDFYLVRHFYLRALNNSFQEVLHIALNKRRFSINLREI